MKIRKVLTIILLIAALAGVGFLVKNNQDTRSGASFADVEALFLPGSKRLKIGEEVTTTMMIDTKERLLTGVDLRIKYDQSVLELRGVEVLSKNSASASKADWLGGENEVIISNINQENGTYELVGTNTGKDVNNLSKGIVTVVKLNFIAIANGEAKVSLDSNYKNMIAGYNDAGSDQELKINKISDAVYTVIGIEAINTKVPDRAACAWCGDVCMEISEKENYNCIDVLPIGKDCISQNGKCVVVSNMATE